MQNLVHISVYMGFSPGLTHTLIHPVSPLLLLLTHLHHLASHTHSLTHIHTLSHTHSVCPSPALLLISLCCLKTQTCSATLTLCKITFWTSECNLSLQPPASSLQHCFVWTLLLRSWFAPVQLTSCVSFPFGLCFSLLLVFACVPSLMLSFPSCVQFTVLFFLVLF